MPNDAVGRTQQFDFTEARDPDKDVVDVVNLAVGVGLADYDLVVVEELLPTGRLD